MPRKKKESTLVATGGTFSIAGTKHIDDCEWCFQFDDNDPIVFATALKKDFTTTPKISFTLTNRTDSTMTFFDEKSGKKLKLYSREKINK